MGRCSDLWRDTITVPSIKSVLQTPYLCVVPTLPNLNDVWFTNQRRKQRFFYKCVVVLAAVLQLAHHVRLTREHTVDRQKKFEQPRSHLAPCKRSATIEDTHTHAAYRLPRYVIVVVVPR